MLILPHPTKILAQVLSESSLLLEVKTLFLVMKSLAALCSVKNFMMNSGWLISLYSSLWLQFAFLKKKNKSHLNQNAFLSQYTGGGLRFLCFVSQGSAHFQKNLSRVPKKNHSQSFISTNFFLLPKQCLQQSEYQPITLLF